MEIPFYEKEADAPFHFYMQSEKDNHTLAHFHNGMEIIVVREGRQRVIINGTERALARGDVGVSDRLDVHFYEPLGSSSVTILVLGEEYTARFRNRGGRLGNFLSAGERADELFDVLDHLFAARNGGEIVLGGYIDVLLGTLASLQKTPPRERREEKIIVRILQYLEEHYAEHITLGMLADRFGYSVPHFSSLFNRCTGMHFKDYLNRLRAGRAAEFSARGKHKLEEILRVCGFESPNTYYRAMRRWQES